MIFAQMLEIVALSDLASVLCARKFSFDPQGGDLPAAERPQRCVLVGLSALAVEAYGFTLVRPCVRS